MTGLYIVRLDSYTGKDTYLSAGCGDDHQDFLFCIVKIGDTGAEVIDNGYRSFREAAETWPDAVNA